jgi:Glycosyl transferases group 1
MSDFTKPKLVFFQFKPSENLSKFVLLHRQQHVKCLSEFFDVTVISQDCDYQQVCDQHQPDLTLFESGVNYLDIQRIDIKNTHVHPEIPKLGLHNGDSWCEARSGFLSDMKNWGIETFFSICTTTAEHTPEIADNLFVWPNCVDPETYRDYGLPKVVPVFFTGFIHQLYPWRQKVHKVISQYYPSLTCPHSGYSADLEWRMIYGEKYSRTINASWFVPTCGTAEKEILRKHFEIPASKSCLITEKTAALEAAGFVDMENCVFADENDVLEKLDYLFQNLDELEKITEAGYKLVHSRHTLKQRDQIFQWFNLYKHLQADQKIIQPGPFEPLIVVKKSSESKNSHVTCNGLVIDMLDQGAEKLRVGQYDEAKAIYNKCFHHISWMPEPKLGLALCELYTGNAEAAFTWISQPITYTLLRYKATNPDPVEWTYLVISLLCQGKFVEAAIRANQFPSDHHPELERLRWAINCLRGAGKNSPMPSDQFPKTRYSVHKPLTLSLDTWTNNLCTMLRSCQQFGFAEELAQATQHHKKNPRQALRRFYWFIRLGLIAISNNLFEKLHIPSQSGCLPSAVELDYIIRLAEFLQLPSLKRYIIKLAKLLKLHSLKRYIIKLGSFLKSRLSIEYISSI